MLTVNSVAPDFSLRDQHGSERTLEEFRGKYVVVYFYPKEGTAGCIKEACDIRDSYEEFEKRGVAVIGISLGTPEKHAEFAETYKLPFTLLSDLDQKIASAYGAKGWFLPKRITYLISPTGSVLKCYPQVDPASHSAELLADIQKVQARQGD